MKQYFVINAGSDEKVVRVKDGKVEFYEVISTRELPAYILDLESLGYEHAKYVPKWEAKVTELEEELEYAKLRLEEAKKHPLKISEEDAKKYGLIKNNYNYM